MKMPDRKHKSAQSLILGTVQFGLPYGVNKEDGQPDIGQVRDLLNLAFEKGIRELDTAAAYGTSEEVLGACGIEQWSVITKVPSLRDVEGAKISANAYDYVQRSFERLKVSSLQGLLAHDHNDLIGDRGRHFYEGVAPLMASGQIKKLGVSVYEPDDVTDIIAPCRQIIQLPLNIFDQRFVLSGAASRLKAEGAELHARSLFLQGLLLMHPDERPSAFARWKKQLAEFDSEVQDSNKSALSLCLGYARAQEDIARLVIGVNTPEQLMEILDAFQDSAVHINFDKLSSDDISFIDPRKWGNQA